MGNIFGGFQAGGQATNVAPDAALWANRATYQASVGRLVRFTDVGGGTGGVSGGTVMVWNGTRWRPIGGVVTLDAIDTANAGAANTTEQQLNTSHIAIPSGLLADGDRIRVIMAASKSGTSDTATLRYRFGPAGTTADTLLTTISSLAATNQSYQDGFEYKRLGATSIQQQGNGSFKGASVAAFPSAVTVSSMDANPMFLSITAQMTSGTETPTVQNYTLEWYPTDV